MPKNITIYTTNTCAYCAMVKKFLDAKSLAYEVVNLDDEPDRRQEAYDISNGATTVPITVVTKSDDSREVVVGWNPAKLNPAVTV